MKLNKPLIIGLTGTIGSGKSTCSEILKNKFSLPVIDADEIAYKVSDKGSSGLNAIAQAFGQEYILPDGSYNRKLMSKTVFEDPEALEKLNNIIHPFIKEEKQSQLDKLGNEEIIIYDCPLLFESGEDKTVDKIIVITSDEILRKERIRERSNLSDKEIENRIKSQESEEEKISKADYVVSNNGSITELEASLKDIIKDLK